MQLQLIAMSNESKPYLCMFDAISYTCYEVGHTWDPSCFIAFVKAFKNSFVYGLKLMASFYGADFVIKSLKNQANIKEDLYNFLRSCTFVAACGSFSLGGFCLLRHILGKFYGWHSFAVALVTGYICLNIERKSKRKMIAMYLIPAAIEILYQMAVCRNYIKPLPCGEVILFCVASCGLTSLFRTPKQMPEYICNIFKFFLGMEESPQPSKISSWTLVGNTFLDSSHFSMLLSRMNLNEFKHPSCPHDFSCLHYVLKGFSLNFLFGTIVDVLLHCYRRKSVKGINKNLHFSYFLSCYVALFRLSSCGLRWLRKRDSPPLHGAVCGAVAGLASMLNRSSTISLYMFVKLLEVALQSPASRRFVPRLKYAEHHIFALSLGIILHAAFLEPHTINPKFWRLFCSLSGNKFPLMFRKLLDVYGTRASLLYPNFVPNLDKRFVTSDEVRQILIANEKW